MAQPVEIIFGTDPYKYLFDWANNKLTTYTVDSTLAVTDNVVIVNKATAITITLPAATGSGRTYYISNIGAGTCTVDGNTSDTINGQTTQLLFQYESMILVDYGAGTWTII